MGKPDWLTGAEKGKSSAHRYRDLTQTVGVQDVEEAAGKPKTKRRQKSRTVHLNEDIANEVDSAISHYAEEWNVPKNDVWQYALLLGLQAIADGEQPTVRQTKQKVVLPDIDSDIVEG